MIDLHCPSTFSDGQLSVEQLYAQAKLHGVSMLALTDHDTVAGVELFQKQGKNDTLTCIPGIEVSVRWYKHDIHVLGLNIAIDHASIVTLVAQQTQKRRARAEAIAASLAQLGVENPLQKAENIAGHHHLARPHFAQVLVDCGYVKNVAQAFKQYLKRGRPAYHACQWVDLAEAISAIKVSGGVAALAHPQKYGLTQTKLKRLIEDFIDVGGKGIEVVSGISSQKEMQQIAAFCQEYGMLASTGSDFHGGEGSHLHLGGQPALPDNLTPIWSLWTNEQGI